MERLALTSYFVVMKEQFQSITVKLVSTYPSSSQFKGSNLGENVFFSQFRSWRSKAAQAQNFRELTKFDSIVDEGRDG